MTAKPKSHRCWEETWHSFFFELRSCWLECFVQTAEQRLRPKRTFVRWDVVKVVQCLFIIYKVFQFDNPSLESSYKLVRSISAKNTEGLSCKDWAMDGTATFLRLSVDLDQWEAICAEEVERNPWKSYSTFIFSKYCQTVSDDWIFPIKKKLILFFACWQMKRNKVFHLDRISRRSSLRAQPPLGSLDKTLSSTTAKFEKKATMSCFFPTTIARTVSVPFYILPWAFFVLPWAIWFCRKLFGFAVSYFLLPWTICVCGDSYGPMYLVISPQPFNLNQLLARIARAFNIAPDNIGHQVEAIESTGHLPEIVVHFLPYLYLVNNTMAHRSKYSTIVRRLAPRKRPIWPPTSPGK